MAVQVDRAKFVDLLDALCKPDRATRQNAETLYQQAKQSEPDGLMLGLLAVLGSADVQESLRRQAAVLLRQLVTRGHERDFAFARVTQQHQQEFAAELLRVFENEASGKVQSKIGDVVSKLAEHVCNKDDPRGSLAPGSPSGWPALLPQLFRMADASSSTSPQSCEAALRVLLECLPTVKGDVVEANPSNGFEAKQQLGHLLQAGLSHANLRLRTASLLLVCGIVNETDKTAWAPLLQTGAMLMQVLQQLAEAGEEDLLQEAVQAFIEVASREPDFFKPQLTASMEPAKFMAAVARSRDNVANGMRSLALEWLVTYLEKRVKWLTKHLKQYPPIVLEACMDFLLEVDADEEEVKAWAARMDDEEGDEDEDELLHVGEQSIDRIAEAIGIEDLSQPLFQLIGHFVAQEPWQAKIAALAAVKQIVEYLEERNHIDEMAQLLLRHLDHPHPRVRFMALHAIGQLANDQSPTFQEAWHQTVMPALMKMMDDPVDRVTAMAMSAFVSFAETLDTSLMSTYSQAFMEKLVAKLQTTQHRGVREESITSVAVIAGNIGKAFSQYYDAMMPVLKQFIMNATGEKESRLRGKSFECMSLLGIAVGKDKFLPDAQGAISEMLKTSLDADDMQREYIKEASERICQCLKREFAQFLPSLLPGLLKTLKFDQVGEAIAQSADDDDMYVKVTAGDGKLVQVHSQKFEEMKQSLQLLMCFCTEVEGAYFDFVQPTAEVLMPLLANADAEFATWCEEVRCICLQVWGLLIKAARSGSDERSLSPEVAQGLLSTGLRTTFVMLDRKKDAETLCGITSGITQCIKNVGKGIIKDTEVKQIAENMFALIDQSMGRSQRAASEKKQNSAGVPRELGDEENDDEDWEEGEEEQLRRNCEEVLGAVMEVAAAHFLPCLPLCGERIGTWLQSEQNKVLGLYLACDLLLHLKEKSVSIWPIFMKQVFASLALGEKEDPDARTAAAYAIQMAAPFDSFSEAAPEAFRRLAQIVGGPKPKKRDAKGKLALDNAVAALIAMAKQKPNLCPPEIQAWPLALSRLPLRDDEEEARKVHGTLVDLVIAQDPGVLGGPSRSNLGRLLSVFAEVYLMENICSKATEEKIMQVFKLIPADMLQSLASAFTEKQQKKIEKILSS